jgi:hypothetical protein
VIGDKKKKTLHWTESEGVVVWSGVVEFSITGAKSISGKRLYSIRPGRIDKDTGERASDFLRIEDMDDLIALAQQVKAMDATGEFPK